MSGRRFKVLLFLLSLFSIACTRKNQLTNILRYPIENDPPTLDWSLQHEHVSLEVSYVLHEGLTKHDENLNVVPALSESWTVSKDGKIYTFRLRDAKWSDGVPVRAEDFVFGWQRLLDPKRAAEYAYFMFDVENAFEYNSGKISDFSKVGVRALDDKHVEVRLKYAASYFPHIPTFGITYPQRRDMVEGHPSDYTEPAFLRCAGPYRLVEWKHDSRLTLEVNPYYYGKKPEIEKVQFLVVKEDSTALNMYERGELDVALRVPSLALDRVKKWPDYRSFPVLRGYYYGFNVNKKPFDNIWVRKAFASALDREEVVKVLKGGQIPTRAWVPKGMFGYEANVGISYDVKRAREYLAKGGYPDGKNFPKVTMMYDTLELNKQVAEKLQFNWKVALNVSTIELVAQEWKVYLDTLTHDAPPLFRMGWGADYPDPHNFLDLFTSRSGQNNTRWKNTKYDKLVLAGAGSSRLSERLKIYKNVQKLLLEDEATIMPIFQQSIEMVLKPHVKGFSFSPIEMPQIAGARIEKPAQ